MSRVLLLLAASSLFTGCGSTLRIEVGDGKQTAALEWRLPGKRGLAK